MRHLRPVTLQVDLPAEVAAKLEEMQREQPDLLSLGIRYLVARREIFDVLSGGSEGRVVTKVLT